jgi:hypothetical protein
MQLPKPTSNSQVKKLVEAAHKLPDSIFQFVQDVTDRLTLWKLLLTLIAALMATFVVLVYENRNAVVENMVSYLSPKPAIDPWEISQQSKVEIIRTIRSTPLLNMILVTQIDLQKNRRYPRFWHLESPQEPNIRNKAAMIMPQPVFDYDSKNTSQILSILNTDFLCVPIQDTIFFKLFPELETEMPIICRMSIPPLYGHVTGILTFGLTKTPSSQEMTQIKQIATQLSTDIYMRDILHRSNLIPNV